MPFEQQIKRDAALGGVENHHYIKPVRGLFPRQSRRVALTPEPNATGETSPVLAMMDPSSRADMDDDLQNLDPAARSQAILAMVLQELDDDKAEDIVNIDLSGKSDIADAMVIASGRSQRHVGAVADKILRRLKEAGHDNARSEGQPACDWVLIDAGDVIVHIFRPEVRSFYNLERIWSEDAKTADSLPRPHA